MKAFFKWVLIILFSAGAVIGFRAYQDRNDGVLEQIAQEEETAQVEEIVVVEEEAYTTPEGWITYENTEYDFSLAHPEEWESQEALKPSRDYALHEISIHAKEYEMHRPSFTVRIFVKESGQTVLDWWNARLAFEDAKKGECVAKNGENAPCLYLRDMVDAEEETELLGQPAYRAEIFQFDHQEECIYVANEEYVFGLCYDGSNPNDANFEENKVTTGNILNSFVSGLEDEGIDTNAVLEGTWKSVEDEKSVIVFGAEGVYRDVYDGGDKGEGVWSLLEDGTLEKNIGDEVYSYKILSLTEGELTLSFIPRGNTLKYVRVTEVE